MKPTISGSNAFGVGPDESPSDRNPLQVAEAKSQRPEADSPIGRPTTGDLAHGREVSGIGLKGTKSVLLPLNSGCLGKTDGSATRCRNAVSRAGSRAFRRNARVPVTPSRRGDCPYAQRCRSPAEQQSDCGGNHHRRSVGKGILCAVAIWLIRSRRGKRYAKT